MWCGLIGRSIGHAVNCVFRLLELQEWSARDVYTKHSIKANHGRIIGRLDDLIIHSDGLKFMPLSFEAAIAACSIIKSALMFGGGRRESGFLIELATPTATDRDGLIGEILAVY